MNDYFSFIHSALADGKFSKAERQRATELAAKLSPDQIRVVHAQTMSDVLRECLRDGEISATEVEYLAKLRRFLRRVGWAP